MYQYTSASPSDQAHAVLPFPIRPTTPSRIHSVPVPLSLYRSPNTPSRRDARSSPEVGAPRRPPDPDPFQPRIPEGCQKPTTGQRTIKCLQRTCPPIALNARVLTEYMCSQSTCPCIHIRPTTPSRRDARSSPEVGAPRRPPDPDPFKPRIPEGCQKPTTDQRIVVIWTGTLRDVTDRVSGWGLLVTGGRGAGERCGGRPGRRGGDRRRRFRGMDHLIGPLPFPAFWLSQRKSSRQQARAG
jgi:hypothetical protein